ncbi:hypothetical protein BH11PSE1_BH11PSE1_26800 [soil metagenome]
MSLDNARISTKLIVAFAVILSVFTLVSITLFGSLNATLDSARKNNVSYQNSRDIAGTLAMVVEQQNAVRAFAATSDPKFLESYQERGAQADKHLADFAGRTTKPEQRERAKRLAEAIAQWRGETDAQLALLRDPATLDQGRAIVETLRLTQVREAQGELSKAQDALVAKRWTDQQKAIAQAQMTLILGAVTALAAAVLMAWLLSRAIASPVRAMTQVMGKLAGGDNDVEVPAIGRKDEVGQMAVAVLAFKDAALEKLRLEAQAEADHAEVEAERRRNEAANGDAAAQQAVVVSALAQGLSALSKGDLTVRITENFAPDYVQLKRDYNAALQSLQDTMQVISGNTNNMRSGAGEISTAADDLSRRTEKRAASMAETAAAIDEITATVRRTAEGANHARQVVGTAKTDAEASGEIVRRAVDAMSQIEGSSRQISQIIGVIDEIAFQTNLLALNAGVEAARAGDAGKGFAVVASEVRALAQRSAEAAKEIKALISASTAQVGAGVSLVAETGQALQRIAAQVAEITGVVGEIAASAQEQATGLHQVNTAVNQMDQVTQQNAAMVEQSTAASHALAGEAAELSRLMSQFRIGAVEAAPPKTASRVPTARPTRAYAQSGSAALKMAAPEQNDWEEF